MLDSLTSENYSDFSSRYSHTYGWLVRPNENKQFVYLGEVSNNRINFYIDNSDFSYYANRDSGVQFEFIPVDHGWFNGNDGSAYYLTRIPSRQWKRGISDHNTRVFDLNIREVNLNIDNLLKIFNSEFSKLNYPNEFLKHGALSKHFALNSGTGNVYFYNYPVGTYDDITATITLTNELVFQELQDLINRNKWDVIVKL